MCVYRQYTEQDYRKILQVYADCKGVSETARRTGFPVGTVHRIIKKYGSLEGFEADYDFLANIHILQFLKNPTRDYQEMRLHYAYILGMYLGDGHISKTKNHRAHRIMIFLDKKYPQIIERCQNSLDKIFPNNKIGLVYKESLVSVNCYSQQLPDLFPQHGTGRKHNRAIILDDWQQKIVNQYPLEFFRGLYHSDGSRSQNIVKGRNYPRYTFSNVSDDIRKLFTDTTEKLGLSWTTANARNVAISRRNDVAWLDRHIGAKS